MKLTTYLKEKNKILRKYLGLEFDLVPKEQIDKKCDSLKPLKLDSRSANSCPYCLLYSIDGCEECPMSKADNHCTISFDSTWDRYMNSIPSFDGHWSVNSPAYEPMNKLIAKYNKSHGL